MIVVAQHGGVQVDEAEDLKRLNVLARLPEGDAEALTAALGDAGRFDGEHVWLSERWLRDNAGGSGADWTAGFDGMIAFARSHGWVDDAGAVRAHVEWVG